MKRNLLILLLTGFIICNFSYLRAGNSLTTISHSGYVIISDGKMDDIKVQIFPNPLINNQLNIESNKEFFLIEVLDIVGKRIFIEEYNTPVSRKVIDLAEFDKGLYLIRIKFENKKVYTEKIVIR